METFKSDDLQLPQQFHTNVNRLLTHQENVKYCLTQIFPFFPRKSLSLNMDLLSMLSERRDPTFFQNNLLALMLNIISLKKGRFSSIEAKKKKNKRKRSQKFTSTSYSGDLSEGLLLFCLQRCYAADFLLIILHHIDLCSS